MLPGVGPKSAQRMAFHLLERNRDGGRALARALEDAAANVGHCRRCRMLTDGEALRDLRGAASRRVRALHRGVAGGRRRRRAVRRLWRPLFRADGPPVAARRDRPGPARLRPSRGPARRGRDTRGDPRDQPDRRGRGDGALHRRAGVTPRRSAQRASHTACPSAASSSTWTAARWPMHSPVARSSPDRTPRARPSLPRAQASAGSSRAAACDGAAGGGCHAAARFAPVQAIPEPALRGQRRDLPEAAGNLARRRQGRREVANAGRIDQFSARWQRIERGGRSRMAPALARARDLGHGRFNARHERIRQRTLAHSRLAYQHARAAGKSLAQRVDSIDEPLARAHDGIADARVSPRAGHRARRRASSRSDLFATTQAARPFHSAAARYRSQSPKSGAGTGATTATSCVRLAATGSASPRESMRASRFCARQDLDDDARRRPRCSRLPVHAIAADDGEAPALQPAMHAPPASSATTCVAAMARHHAACEQSSRPAFMRRVPARAARCARAPAGGRRGTPCRADRA